MITLYDEKLNLYNYDNTDLDDSSDSVSTDLSDSLIAIVGEVTSAVH